MFSQNKMSDRIQPWKVNEIKAYKNATPQSHAWVGRRTNTYQYSKWESRFCLGLDTAKNPHQIKKASNKSCSKLNFEQKSTQTHMSIFILNKARGLERFLSLKNNYVQKQGSRFSFGFDATKNTHRIEKALNKSCSKLNFVQKSPLVHMSISPPEWS